MKNKYVIIYDNKWDIFFASKKLFGIFNVGWLGIVSNTGSSTIERCEADLRKQIQKKSKNKVVKELEI